MNKFHLSCIALLCLFSTQTNASTYFSTLGPLTGSGACAPNITCPPDLTISSGLDDINVIGLPSTFVSQNFCGTPSVSYHDKVNAGLCNTEITRIWTAASFNGNTEFNNISQCRQKILITPRCQLICPPNACVDLTEDISEIALGQPQPTGNSCTLTELSFEDTDSFICDDIMQINRLWTGYFSQFKACPIRCLQTITIGDDSAPTITNCPENINIGSTCDVVQWEEPIANDNCKTVTLSSNFAPGLSEFPLGSTIVRYSANDLCGNASQCEFVVSVLNDGTHPDCPDDINIITDDLNPIEVSWDVPAYTGNCTECPPARPIGGYTFIGSTNGSSFYISTRTFFFEDASREANRLGGFVASITDETENNLITDNFLYSSLLIGLTDVDSEGKFVWESGEPLSYENWFANQPNDHQRNQDYVEILPSGEWNDIDNKKLCYVLEIPCKNVRQVGGPPLGQRLFSGSYTISYVIEDGCGLSMCCSFDINIEFNGRKSFSSELGDEKSNNEITNPINSTTNSSEIKYYPNPVHDILTVEIPDFEDVNQINILTMGGKSISQIKKINYTNTVSMNNLNPGLHLILIEYKSGEVKYEKVMKI